MRKFFISLTATLVAIAYLPNPVQGQQYKLKQTSTMMGFKTESVVYVKGPRKRTEGGGVMGMGAGIVTIEQCDLQRTVKLNDKKKLYFIEPFAKDNDEVIDEDENANKKIPVKQSVPNTNPQKGGVITQWSSIRDTGERKNMFGFTARHVWTSTKMKPSADACYMKDSMQIKTDGWYIDLPKFNCPVNYRPARPPRRPNEPVQPECKDRFVTHRSGKGKLGFPLIETTTIITGAMQGQEIKTSIETTELSTAALDSMLFEIPPGYQEAKSEDELNDNMNLKDIIKNAKKEANENTSPSILVNTQKKSGIIRIGVFAPTGDEEVQAGLLQKQMVGTLTGGNVEAISVSSEEEAKKYNCDYTLTSAFTKIKSASKVGGILKAIKNADPNAASAYNVQANLTLKLLNDGSVKSEPSVDGKYDGKIDEAAGKALNDGCRAVLKALK